jgi:hypothetical protein
MGTTAIIIIIVVVVVVRVVPACTEGTTNVRPVLPRAGISAVAVVVAPPPLRNVPDVLHDGSNNDRPTGVVQ